MIHSPARIALLDVDGVLLKPGGYRASVLASMNTMLEQMCLTSDTPVEEIALLFESVGITCEWDMLPLMALITIDAAAAQHDLMLPTGGLEETIVWLRGLSLGRIQADFSAAISSFKTNLNTHPVPSVAIYQARQSGAALFTHLDHQPFLAELLCHTRDFEHSSTLRLFQNYVLGGDLFAQTYQVPPLQDCPSKLKEFDQPLLEPAIASRMMDHWRGGQLALSLFTARPSLPPVDALTAQHGYSPEAEMAVDLLGLHGIPVMGYGRLQWLAEQVAGGFADLYLKPSPVQALAALRAALTRSEAESLLWAQAASLDTPPENIDTISQLPQKLDVHIFEDSTVGMVAGSRASDRLTRHGHHVDLHRWGIAKHPAKIAALQHVGAAIYPDINTALRQAFPDLF